MSLRSDPPVVIAITTAERLALACELLERLHGVVTRAAAREIPIDVDAMGDLADALEGLLELAQDTARTAARVPIGERLTGTPERPTLWEVPAQ